MDIMNVLLIVLLVAEVLLVGCYVVKVRKRQPRDEKIAATEKMVRKILLNNKWHNIDAVVEKLEKESLHIHYKLR